MFLQLILALVLLALPGCLQQDDDCTVSQTRDVRLSGGTEYAGRVEVCWEINGSVQTVYKWQSVCAHMWGLEEARAVCDQLDYTNSTVAGLLLCGAECIGQGTGPRVQLSCPNNNELCTMTSIEVSPCSETRSQDARVVCAIPPSGLCKPNTTSAAKICEVLGEVAGAVIIAMVIALVGMNLGWAWFYHRRSGKQKINGEIATPNEAQVCCNHTYEIPTYNKTSHTENHTPSVKDQTTSFNNSPGMIPASAISCHPLINGEQLMYQTLEGPTSVENIDRTFHMLPSGEEQDQDYASITNEDEEGKNYVTLRIEDTSLNSGYSQLQYK